MIIHFVAKPGNGPDWHRLAVPMGSLPLEDGDSVAMAIYETDETPELFECDVLVFNRNIRTPVDQLIRLRKKKGFKIVLDLDDFWELGPSHPLYATWKGNRYDEEIFSYIKIADLVMVTTQALADKVRPHNARVEVVPNGLEFTEPIPAPRFTKTKFIYAGSVTHIPDIELLKNRFRRIDPYIRDSASFILAGVGEHKGWDIPKAIFKSTGSYEFLPVLPLDQYMQHYDNANVALIPLVDNEFNRHKSILKVIEAASKGLACIVSQVQPYYPELKDAPLMWVKGGSDWLRHIRFCIKNPRWLADQGRQLYEFMKERYSLSEINKKRYEVLCSVLHPQV